MEKKPKIGDTTMFVVDGELRAVEIIGIVDCWLKVMSCDLELVWNNISISKWNKQVEFINSLNPNPEVTKPSL